MVSKHLLVVVQSKHSVVEAGKDFNKRRLKLVLLTDDTVEYLPVRRIENPVGLAGGEDERSCEPIMIEHLGANFQQIRKTPEDLALRTDKGQVETHRRGRL